MAVVPASSARASHDARTRCRPFAREPGPHQAQPKNDIVVDASSRPRAPCKSSQTPTCVVKAS